MAALLLAIVMLRSPDSSALVYFLLPPCAMMAVLVSRELSNPQAGDGNRFAAFFKMLGHFVAGTALPVLIFLIPYIRSGAVRALLHGVFVLPTKRFESASMAPPSLDKMIFLVPILLLVYLAYLCGSKGRVYCGSALA